MEGIYFPGLGIYFEKVWRTISILGVKLPLYAICVTVAFLLALVIASKEAKRTGQNDEDYLDFFLWLVVPAILGARIYYVLFNLNEFVHPKKSVGQTIIDMINIHNGGLAVYGGLIAGVLTGFFFARKRKLNFPLFGDTIALGVVVAQIVGRWGNFFNRECFGAYTASKFRMAIPINYYNSKFYQTLRLDGIITQDMVKNQEVIKGIACITVHPTFLYEGIWNLALFIFLLLYRKKKKFDGELAMIYVAGYGLGRFWIEWLRTDSLRIGNIKASQLVAAICFFLALAVIIKNRIDIKKGKTPKVNYVTGKKADSDDEDDSEDKDEVEESTKDTESKSEDIEDTEDEEEEEQEKQETSSKKKAGMKERLANKKSSDEDVNEDTDENDDEEDEDDE